MWVSQIVVYFAKKEKLFNYRPNDDSDSRKLLFSLEVVILQDCLQVLPKIACIMPFVLAYSTMFRCGNCLNSEVHACVQMCLRRDCTMGMACTAPQVEFMEDLLVVATRLRHMQWCSCLTNVLGRNGRDSNTVGLWWWILSISSPSPSAPLCLSRLSFRTMVAPAAFRIRAYCWPIVFP